MGLAVSQGQTCDRMMISLSGTSLLLLIPQPGSKPEKASPNGSSQHKGVSISLGEVGSLSCTSGPASLAQGLRSVERDFCHTFHTLKSHQTSFLSCLGISEHICHRFPLRCCSLQFQPTWAIPGHYLIQELLSPGTWAGWLLISMAAFVSSSDAGLSPPGSPTHPFSSSHIHRRGGCPLRHLLSSSTPSSPPAGPRGMERN